MFELNPLNLPDAQMQHVLMLVVAGVLGFIIGYVSRQNVISQLESELTSVGHAVDDCQRARLVPDASNEETIILNRIRARAGEVNFTRIGLASVDEADDLKDIVGIGPFLERKLHAIDIYTFRQIANFNQDDIEKVNDIIEFFPGRIERDRWVSQAKELAKKK
ncbi:hypothetical protein [Spirosoma validum]|uniref:DUF4332 domain-containing protein n=1 Tax=Spirosoma validum TaxID=2771355 RepID=A0A927B2T8_9BACT|nr:hypothetical protein [Spirosoma validum]MBD2754293.1 hypothetical protein [Spirosoma validum]